MVVELEAEVVLAVVLKAEKEVVVVVMVLVDPGAVVEAMSSIVAIMVMFVKHCCRR